MNNNNELEIKKTYNKREYMREYMRKYNLKKKGEPRKKLTDDEKKERLKTSHRKYYLKNKENILKKQQKKIMSNRIQFLTDKLKTL